MKSLIIVESPTKARTLKKFLDNQYEVKASVGHLKDLPKKTLGVNIERNFEPEYITIRGKGKVLKELRDAAAKADKVFLAPDPDREGEAIAWHISEELKRGEEKDVYRVLFNEITKQAVQEALKHPGRIDQNKVDAQQARRVLDRLVGYKISPLLWKKVTHGLSAGRVQSVALRLICDREREIEAFKPQEYWSITASLQKSVSGFPFLVSGFNQEPGTRNQEPGTRNQEPATTAPFAANLVKIGNKKAEVKDEQRARAIAEEVKGFPFIVDKLDRRERKRNPLAPFITSQLQQEASRRLRFSPQRTMIVAQRLYEGIDLGSEGPVGLITYMRTDSPRVASQAQDQAREYIGEKFGAKYLPSKPPTYKSRASAQEAHEAIRPTLIQREPESIRAYLSDEQFALYQLIWQRFLASQMVPALYDVTTAEISAGKYLFRATGTIIKFPGFTRVYVEAKEEPSEEAGEDREEVLPPLETGETLQLKEILPKQHFTQPPPRYSEATLVKELEEKGIGRPSTYATIVTTIKERDYVRDEKRKLYPTELGKLVSDLLIEHFPDILSVTFTATMENQLDEIEEGKVCWTDTLARFYQPFQGSLERAQREMKEVKRRQTPTDIACEKCGRQMVIKWGRKGYFLACQGYPDCKNTAEFVQEGETIRVTRRQQEVSETCEKCGQSMLIKEGRFGKFLACSGYPKCKNTRKLSSDEDSQEPLPLPEEIHAQCERCGSPMVARRGRYGRFLSCSRYPECKFIKPLSLGIACPQEGCQGQLVSRKSRRGKIFYGCSNYPKCNFALWERPISEPCPQCQAPFLVEQTNKGGGTAVKCFREECGYKRSR